MVKLADKNMIVFSSFPEGSSIPTLHFVDYDKDMTEKARIPGALGLIKSSDSEKVMVAEVKATEIG